MPHPPVAAADVLRDLSRWYNYCEVAIWPAIGFVLGVAGFRRVGVVRRDFWRAAAVLFAFGPTDYFEAANGNEWWHPWWLFLWKAACVVALVVIVATAWRRERRRSNRPPDTAPGPPSPEGAEAP